MFDEHKNRIKERFKRNMRREGWLSDEQLENSTSIRISTIESLARVISVATNEETRRKSCRNEKGCL